MRRNRVVTTVRITARRKSPRAKLDNKRRDPVPLPTREGQPGPLGTSAPSSRADKRLTLHRFTCGLRPSTLASTTQFCVALGLIIAAATSTPAQSLPEQLPSESEKTKDIDSTKDKADPTYKDGANPWLAAPTEKAPLANLAPFLLPYFNNGPVFGVPGTDTSDFWHSTQRRTEPASAWRSRARRSGAA